MSAADLSDVVDELGNTTLAVTRRGRPTLSLGMYTPGATTTLAIPGVIWPATPRDVLSLPEGRRTERTVVAATKVALQGPTAPGDGLAGLQGDLIAYQGETFEVLRVEPWAEHGFYRSLAVKVGQ